jgi:transcriptional regulator with XRE-family HTH domain
MSYLQEQWTALSRQHQPRRRYASQREFEADWVSGLRRRFSLSQEALASLASVSVTTVQNWENPASLKNIAGHNQDRLRDIERSLWISSHVTLMEPCPAFIRALHDLLAANKDSSAQGLADYLLGSLPASDPERPRLLHWASLTHSIADPASQKARDYQAAALASVGQGESALSVAIENEILGSQFEDLICESDTPERRERAEQIMAACERLHARDHQPAYLWNALEVACRAGLPTATRYRLLTELTSQLGAGPVKRRVLNDEAYEAVRDAYNVSAALN